MTPVVDVAIIGGGIIGLATAWRMTEIFPGLGVTVLEKENLVAAHQSGRNSGVIHSGIYYRPGSSRSRHCVDGGRRMKTFCDEHGIALETCGKVVVATDERELPMLEELHQRGSRNGVPGLDLLGPEQLHEIEPHARGLRALHVPGAAITDYAAVARKLADLATAKGGEVRLGERVSKITHDDHATIVQSSSGELRTRYLINCGGLHADRLARLASATPDLTILPFRGEYHELVPERRDLVRGMIYPVPDPQLPFLGIHLTRRIDGRVEAGPNAVLALHREGYGWSRFSFRDIAEAIGTPGFWRMARRHWRTGWHEVYRSLSRRAFAKSCRKLVPEISTRDLRTGNAGVRAQCLASNGSLMDDFALTESPRALHVLNAPSPAATSSLSIADEIVERASAAMGIG